MASLNHLSLLLLFVAFALAIRPSVSPIPTKNWHVHVVNNLSDNKILLVHCKSGDNDLGEHNLTVGAEFAWKFKQQFFERTLFWCFVGRPEGFCASFDVFWNDDAFLYRCNYKECFWIVREKGIYLKNIPEDYEELRHKWSWPPC